MVTTGWMNPNGRFIECALFKHIQTASVFGIEEIDDLLYSVKAAEENCNAMADEYGNSNAEWHTYEMATTGATWKIRDILLKLGYLRVGQSHDGIHFEGTPPSIYNLYQTCRDLAESYSGVAIFEPIRSCTNI